MVNWHVKRRLGCHHPHRQYLEIVVVGWLSEALKVRTYLANEQVSGIVLPRRLLTTQLVALLVWGSLSLQSQRIERN